MSSPPPELTRAEKIQTLAGMLLAMFLAALDQTVVATAGPDIQRTLALDASLYSWITTAYLVSSTVLVPVYGKLSDLIGRKKVVIWGVVVFVGASVLCGVAQTPAQLIGFRALQGVGSASLFTSAFAVVADLFPPSERGKYSGLFGAVFGVSSLVGPLLGGFITDHFGWHWVFFINLPLGIIALGFIVARMPPLKPHLEHTPRIDVFGAVLLAIAVVPLLIALTLGRPEVREGELGWSWTDWRELSLFGASAFGLVTFIWWELRVKEPLVDLHIFRNRTVALGSAASFLLGGAFLTPMVFLPLFMVNVVGVTATQSGLTISPLVLGVVAGNVLSGQLVSRFGKYKNLMIGGLVLQIAGFLVMAFTLDAESTQREVTVKMVLLGLGLGPSIPLYTIAIQNAVEVRQLGVTTAMVTFLRQMGSTVGIAIVGSLFATTLSQELATKLKTATEGLPPEMVQRFTARGAAEEGAQVTRFDPDAVKKKVADQLEGARAVAQRALDGEAIALSIVESNPMTPPELRSAVVEGGVKQQVRTRFTVVRAKLRRAAESDEAWAELRSSAPELPEKRPSNESAIAKLDAELEASAERAADAAYAQAMNAVTTNIEAQRPRLFATIDAVGRGLREGFTVATTMVYRLAAILATLALIITLALPQLPLRGRAEALPPVME
ncbi:MAG: MDR family MFS transporter [Archangium sp.]